MNVLRQAAPTCNHLPWRRAGRVARGAAGGVLVWLSLAAAPPAALAQENAEALASRALFDEARRLMNAGQFAAACPKLEESQRLRAGIGTQFNLAECYEKLGRFASAWSLYLRVAADTKALGQAEREQVARTRAQALEPRVAYLLLHVPAPVQGLEVTLDGSVMRAASWSVPTPIDPGEHAVVARAAGHRTWQGVARIPDRTARVSLEVPRLESLAPARPAAPAAAAPPLAVEPRADAASADAAESGRDLTWPYLIGGTGAGLVLISGLFGLRFINQNNLAKDVCSSDPNACPNDEIEQHESLLREARGARAAGFVTLALGLVGVGVGAAWLLDSSEEAPEGAASVAFGGSAGPSAAFLDCSVRF